MSTTLAIDVHFDLICPWCLIGKRHLRTAIEQFRALHPNVEITVAWRSHQLLSDIPAAGIPYQAFYERRLGGPAAVAARRAQVQAAARTAGIEFAFERIALMPNTQLAHRLIDCAGEFGGPEQVAYLIERLFAAYFMEGRNIGALPALLAVAAEAGFPAAAIEARLASPGAGDHFRARLASDTGISGVPFFVFNNRLTVSGAQPLASLLAAMEQALLPTAATQPV
jgi:predicted DsbA family dithiol-disulfide isomerase